MGDWKSGVDFVRWEAAVTESGGALQWAFHVVNAAEVKKHLKLAHAPGEDSSTAFFKAKRASNANSLLCDSAIRSGRTAFQQKFCLNTSDQHRVWMHEVVRITDTGPLMWHLAGVATDITDCDSETEWAGILDYRYRTIFNASPLPMWIYDPESLRFLEVNEAAVTTYGYSRTEFLGMNLRDIRHPEDIPEFLEAMAKPVVGLSPRGTSRHLRKDGTTFYVEVTSTESTDFLPDGRVVRLTVLRDITERHLAKLALRKSQKNLENAQRLANLGSWTFDAATDTFSMSDQLYRIMGYEPNAFDPNGDVCLKALHPDDQHMLGDLKSLEKMEKFPFEADVRIIRADGEVRVVRSRVQRAEGEQGRSTYYEGTVQDITEASHAQKELNWKSAFLEAYFHSSNIGIYLLDAQWNKILQNHRADILLQGPPELWDSPDVKAQMDLVFSVAKDPEKVGRFVDYLFHNPQESCQEILELLDGAVLECYSAPVIGRDNTFYGRYWAYLDITQSRRNEEALKESESGLRTLMESIPPAVWVCQASGSCEYVNRRWIEISGLSLEQSQGFGWAEAFHPDDLPELMRRWTAAEDKASSFEHESKIRNAAGEYRWHLVTGVPVLDAEGKVTRWFGSCTDIHSRMLIEEELEAKVRSRTAELEVSNLELFNAKQAADTANMAKSEFLSRMSHELRTPLNSILGFGQLLELKGVVPIEDESVKFILKSGRHLLNLINEILDISRVESGRAEILLQPISIRVCFSDAISSMGPIASDYGITLAAQMPDDKDCAVIADPRRLQQVLINLISNGIKYNLAGGQVIVSASHIDNAKVRITVRDTGRGIAESDLNRLFEPFQRLEANFSEIEGTGLGLVLSKCLVESMGGDLCVESELGKGSAFYFDLEMADEADFKEWADDSSSHIWHASDRVYETFRVLSIEDNQANIKLYESILKSVPSVLYLNAKTGAQGVELANQQRPDLILLDLHLPDCFGSEVLAKLKADEATKDIPVLVVTADATTAHESELMAAGATGFMAKPFNIADFRSMLESLMSKKTNEGANMAPTS